MFTLTIYHHAIFDTPLPTLPAAYFRIIEAADSQAVILSCLEDKAELILCSPRLTHAEIWLLATKLKMLNHPVALLTCLPEATEAAKTEAVTLNIQLLECSDFSDESALNAIYELLGLPVDVNICAKNRGETLDVLPVGYDCSL